MESCSGEAKNKARRFQLKNAAKPQGPEAPQDARVGVRVHTKEKSVKSHLIKKWARHTPPDWKKEGVWLSGGIKPEDSGILDPSPR